MPRMMYCGERTQESPGTALCQSTRRVVPINKTPFVPTNETPLFAHPAAGHTKSESAAYGDTLCQVLGDNDCSPGSSSGWPADAGQLQIRTNSRCVVDNG